MFPPNREFITASQPCLCFWWLIRSSKIENFIRTKYESKRWVMDGPMPDPSTLGNDDDTVRR
jgi:hypothetical protein